LLIAANFARSAPQTGSGYSIRKMSSVSHREPDFAAGAPRAVIAVHVVLGRAKQRIAVRLEELGARVDAGDEAAWSTYLQTAATLATVAQLAPSARGELLTTRQLADQMQISSRTLRRKAQRGELAPIRLGNRGRAALRWRA
jgi:hypothetical protein